MCDMSIGTNDAPHAVKARAPQNDVNSIAGRFHIIFGTDHEGLFTYTGLIRHKHTTKI